MSNGAVALYGILGATLAACGRVGYEPARQRPQGDASSTETDTLPPPQEDGAEAEADAAPAHAGDALVTPESDVGASEAVPLDGPTVDGSPQGNGGDVAGAAPPYACRSSTHPETVLCEDFERPWPELQRDYGEGVSSGGELAAVPGPSRRSGTVLRASAVLGASGQTTNAVLLKALPAPVSSGALHVRAYVFMPASFPRPTWLNLVQVAGPDNTNGRSQASLGGDASDRAILTVATGGYVGMTVPGGLPRDRWFCAEIALRVAPAGASGDAELFVDGVSRVKSSPGIATLPPGGITHLTIGPIFSAAVAGTGVVYYDDVVVARAPVGCL